MQGLGDLEGAVMDVLWQSDAPMSVRQVQSELSATRELAYTTVMTVLDNLHRKDWVDRERVGRAWHYLPRETREEAATRVLRRLLDDSGDSADVLLHFVRFASDEESDALRRGLRRRRDP